MDNLTLDTISDKEPTELSQAPDTGKRKRNGKAVVAGAAPVEDR